LAVATAADESSIVTLSYQGRHYTDEASLPRI
jgi:hypothetical protein